jgi:hypothetical protein
MSVSKTPISNATSYQEMAEFWDNHDLTEFWDKIEEVEFEIDIQSKQKYYRLERNLSKEIDKIAIQQGISAETLVNLLLKEKITQTNTQL